MKITVSLILFALICFLEAGLLGFHFIGKVRQEASVQFSEYAAYQEARVELEAEAEEIRKEETVSYAGDVRLRGNYEVRPTPGTPNLPEVEVGSGKWALIDIGSNTVVSQKAGTSRFSPASLTKVLTILVAAEQQPDLDAQFTMTGEILEYCRVKGCTMAGFVEGETVSVRDLFYGAVLPSGGEAAMALAVYTAGSQSAFVERMNAKLEELGLSGTAHMSNCIGLPGKNHYCTLYDMAMILKAAVENDWTREVLASGSYTTAPTQQNPAGITFTSWFLRKIGESELKGTVVAAKNGYEDSAGDCAASYYVSESGTPYICVTSNASSAWRCVNDHAALYQLYAS